MKGINCEVIEDLLPIYVEDMASDSTKALVREHLSNCAACSKKEEDMRKEVELPLHTDVNVLQKISNKVYHKKVRAIFLTVLIMLVISVVAISNLHAPIRMSYENVAEYMKLQVNEQGEVEIRINYPDAEVEVEYGISEDGKSYAQISCYTTKWMQMFSRNGYVQTILLNNPYAEEAQRLEKVYYSPALDGSAICIYQAEENAGSSGGYMELPRLVLNYYMFFAIILTMAGIIICLCLRKNKKAFYMAVKVAVIPVMYLFSSILILSGAGDVYNAVYYLTGIFFVTILLSLICWWGLGYIRRRGNR